MRALGIDAGARRIGVALSDDLGFLAAPLTTVLVRGRELDELAELVRRYGVERVVVGLPTSLDGTEGPQARRVRAFAAALATRLGEVPLVFADERFTTAEAERIMIEQGFSRQKRRERIDAHAAAIMLQGYLDAQRPRRPLRPEEEPS